ncbi:hypothetical protein ESA_03162 [Cronobacter sakazakii ATCC BAA-894]|uniref:Uncharacterized protein n=1 Tax=Cronobacter sakazakii (strain ATCC BAA-894) TaxID=290339 RepID=A7MGT4_CROS8|nr:hypothetical protein ESA_03162 [Cronobacter sakazakii ATCC BAA-894]
MSVKSLSKTNSPVYKACPPTEPRPASDPESPQAVLLLPIQYIFRQEEYFDY